MARSRSRTRIVVPAKFDEWIAGLDDFDPGEEVLAEWARAMELFYGHSQEVVHRITGALQESGDHDTQRDGRTRVVGELTYGGTPECDYAIYEHQRGGSHAFETIAFRMTRGDFERALADGLDKHVRTFL